MFELLHERFLYFIKIKYSDRSSTGRSQFHYNFKLAQTVFMFLFKLTQSTVLNTLITFDNVNKN